MLNMFWRWVAKQLHPHALALLVREAEVQRLADLVEQNKARIDSLNQH